MKKIEMLFGAIAFIAVTSAFATKIKTTDEYVLLVSGFELIRDQPPGGHCEANPGTSCTYEKVGNEFLPLDIDHIWIP